MEDETLGGMILFLLLLIIVLIMLGLDLRWLKDIWDFLQKASQMLSNI